MENKRYYVSEEGERLWNMPLDELSQYVTKIDTTPVGQQRPPDVQEAVTIRFQRVWAQITQENLEEYHKKLRGEPNDFDPYAPY